MSYDETVEDRSYGKNRKLPKRPDPVKVDWWEQQSQSNWHPYNKKINSLLCAYSKLLQVINPKQIDVELARLFALSTGVVEISREFDSVRMNWDPYKKIFYENMDDIKYWFYNAIDTTVKNFSKLFDPNKTMVHVHGEDYWKNQYMYNKDFLSNDYYGCNHGKEMYVELGYTFQMPEDLRTKFMELITQIDKKVYDLSDHRVVEHLNFKLEAIRMDMIRARNRYEVNFIDESYGAPNSLPRVPMHETWPVNQIATPMYTLLPEVTLPQEQSSEAWIDQMEKQYCPCHLKLYGLVLEILSGLRDVKVEGNLYPTDYPDMYCWDNIQFSDEVEKRSASESQYKWIAALPSYRPEFVITLHDFTKFQYFYKRDGANCPFNPALAYLINATDVYMPNVYTIPQDPDDPHHHEHHHHDD